MPSPSRLPAMLCVLPHCTLHQQSFSQLQTPLSVILYHQLGHWQKCDGQREATSSLCYFSTSSALILARKPRSKAVIHPFPCWGWRVTHEFWAGSATRDSCAERNAQLPFLTSLLLSPTHPLTLGLFKTPENQAGREREKQKIISETIWKKPRGCGQRSSAQRGARRG